MLLYLMVIQELIWGYRFFRKNGSSRKVAWAASKRMAGVA